MASSLPANDCIFNHIMQRVLNEIIAVSMQENSFVSFRPFLADAARRGTRPVP